MATATFSGVRSSGQVYVWEMDGQQVQGRALSRTLSSPTTGTSRASVTSTAMATATFSGVNGSGQVYVWEMNGQSQAEGAVNRLPVPSDWHVESVNDFNGDGKSDVLWRQDSGQVYVWEMNGKQVQAEGPVAHAPVTTDWHIFSDLNFI